MKSTHPDILSTAMSAALGQRGVSEGELPMISAEEVKQRIDPTRARKLIEDVLASDFDPAQDPARVNISMGEGHMLLMPSHLGDWAGVKIASVSPGNNALGLPRIQATYLLMDAPTLTPQLLVEGSTLTLLRTPATTAVACDWLAAPDAKTLVVFGTGPQAVEHVRALAEIRDFSSIRLVGRNSEKTERAIEKLRADGIDVERGESGDVAQADVIVCATSAATPLFDGSLVRDGACVAAMGSHEPDRRELDAALMGRSHVIVEDPATAMREAGDVVMAVADGTLQESDLHGLSALVHGATQRVEDRPNVFKGTGMSWQDLAVVAGLA